jgi:hypothetical protein
MELLGRVVGRLGRPGRKEVMNTKALQNQHHVGGALKTSSDEDPSIWLSIPRL